MKKFLLTMALFALGAVGCKERPAALEIDNSLTRDEVSAGILTPEVMWKMRRAGSSSLSPDGKTLLYTVTDYSMEENRSLTRIYTQSLDNKTITSLTDNTSNNLAPQWSADGKKIYFLSNRSGSMQVWEMTPEGSNLRQVTKLKEGVEGFGVSPDGNHLWWVAPVHTADIASKDVHKDMQHSKARIYDDLMVRHWEYWDMGEYRHIFIGKMDPKGVTEGVDIMPEAKWDAPLAPYFDMAEISWNPQSTQLAYTCKPLTGKEYAVSTDSDIYVYDLEKGSSLNICKMASTPEEEFVGYDKYPVWSPSGDKIAFRSQRRAGNEADKERLYVWHSTTGVMQYLTPMFDYNAMNVVWENEEQLLFIAPIEATHQICRVNVPNPLTRSIPVVEVLTSGDHDINAFTLAEGNLVAEVCSISMATEFFTLNTATGELSQFSEINGEIYKYIRMGEVQKRWVKTTDDKQMLVWVILPPDFDASKSYPTLLYCQGGPQSVVSQFWSYRWNFQLMAAQGYVVVAPNRRGLPSFGQEWLDQISGDYSGQNIQDYLSAIDDVAAEPWADEQRMGCVGASYGGYSTYFLAGNHEKRFKAFIAHCGIFDFDSMYGSTEELWFVNNDYGGAYWDRENAIAQRSYANSPHKFVEKWDSPILIITGEKDYRIPYTQSLEAFTAARMRGLDARLVSFENEAHQVFQPQNSMVWNREFFAWLDKYVKNAE